MNASTMILSVAVLIPLHVARAAMKLSVSLLSARDQLQARQFAASMAAPGTDQRSVPAVS